MTFIEFPAWFDNIEHLVNAVANVINQPSESLIFSVSKSNQIFIMVANHDKQLISTLYASDNYALIDRIKNDFLSEVHNEPVSEYWAFQWILQHSNVQLCVDMSNSVGVDTKAD